MCPADPVARSRTAIAVFLFVALSLSLLELLSAAVLASPLARGGEPIRRPSSIFREQSARIETLLSSWDTGLLAVDPTLGWKYRAGYARGRDTINAQGLRSARAYRDAPDTGVLRVAVFGDSFTYGSEVANPDAWPARLEALHPGIEMLNYGIGGYGADQAYLRFAREGTAMQPRIALMGFVSDDLTRLLNVYTRFRASQDAPLFKPRFLLQADSLVLVPPPVTTREEYEAIARHPERVLEHARHDDMFEPLVYRNPAYEHSAFIRLAATAVMRGGRRLRQGERLLSGGTLDSTSKAFALQVRIFEHFSADARGKGVDPIVVFFPEASTLGSIRQGQPAVYATLIAASRARGVACLDASEAFAGMPWRPDAWYAPGGHFSAEGNRIVAQWLAVQLSRRAAP
jgi:hypothetical protein